MALDRLTVSLGAEQVDGDETSAGSSSVEASMLPVQADDDVRCANWSFDSCLPQTHPS